MKWTFGLDLPDGGVITFKTPASFVSPLDNAEEVVVQADGSLRWPDGHIWLREKSEDAQTAEEILCADEHAIRAEAEMCCRANVPLWGADTFLEIVYNPGSNQTLILNVGNKSSSGKTAIFRKRTHCRKFRRSVASMCETFASGLRSSAFITAAKTIDADFLPRYYAVDPLREVMECVDGATDLFTPKGFTPKMRYILNYIWLLPGKELVFEAEANNPACIQTMAAVGHALGELHAVPLDWLHELSAQPSHPACPGCGATSGHFRTEFQRDMAIASEKLFPDMDSRKMFKHLNIAVPTQLYERCKALVPRDGLWADVVTIHFNPTRQNILFQASTGRVTLIDWDDVQFGRRMWDILELALPGGVFHHATPKSLRAFAQAYLSTCSRELHSTQTVESFLYDIQCAVPFQLLFFPRWHVLEARELWRGVGGGDSQAYVLGLVERLCSHLEHVHREGDSEMLSQIAERGIVAVLHGERLSSGLDVAGGGAETD